MDPTENQSLLSELISVHGWREDYVDHSSQLSLEEQVAIGRALEKDDISGTRNFEEFSDREILLHCIYSFYKDEAEAILKSERNGILSKCTEEFRKKYNCTVKDFGLFHENFVNYIENLRSVLTKPKIKIKVGNANEKSRKIENKSLTKDEITKINNRRRMINILFTCRCKTLRCEHMIRDYFRKDKFDLRKWILHRKFQSNFASGMCIRNKFTMIYDEQFRQLFTRTIEIYDIYPWILLRFTKRIRGCVIGSKSARRRKKKSVSHDLLPVVKDKRQLSLVGRLIRKRFQDQFKF